MTWTKRAAPLVVAAAVAVGGAGVPAMGATTTTHWTAKKCTSYKTAFLKRHKKPTKAQLAAANKILKKHSCTIKA